MGIIKNNTTYMQLYLRCSPWKLPSPQTWKMGLLSYSSKGLFWSNITLD